MGDKRRTKNKEGKDKKVELEKDRPRTTTPEDNQEGSFNYGGLPQRNLKKNLGCG